MSGHYIENLRFQPSFPNMMGPSDWREIHGLMAMSAAIAARDADQNAPSTSTHMPTPDLQSFAATRVDPSLLVTSDEFISNQEISGPVVVRAYDTDQNLVGYGYGANVVTGGPLTRRLKHAAGLAFGRGGSMWLRELIVHPEHRSQRIGSALLNALIARPSFADAPSVFMYVPEDNPVLKAFAKAQDMKAVQRYRKEGQTLGRWEEDTGTITDAFIRRTGADVHSWLIDSVKANSSRRPKS